MRYFNNKPIELLAPCGHFEIFKTLLESKADAFYFGGKILNMRMHRKNFNFSNEEIQQAIKMAHNVNKKVYITVNNLLSQQDLKDCQEYLKFLNQVEPDGLIVQDYSILSIIKSLGLNLDCHSSVMMNVHNLESIKKLKELGVTRTVVSREIDLKTIKFWNQCVDMEFEYFTHGDMCVAHGSQCYYSSLVFGQSSNRGLCMKPCRWNFKTKQNDNLYNTEYPLAVKDLLMYENLPEMIDAGITSFKIEGRMRDADYIYNLINCYGDALDRYINDPIGFNRKKDYDYLYKTRKRDFSTAYAFGNPGLSNINRRYEGTGFFYSHGKVFSEPVNEHETKDWRINKLAELLNTEQNEHNKKVKLSVKVNNIEQAKLAIENNIDIIYLSGNVFIPDKPFNFNNIIEICNNKKQSKIILSFPTMTYDYQIAEYIQLLDNHKEQLVDLLDGLLITNIGLIDIFKKYNLPLYGDYTLNIYNQKSADFYKQLGLNRATLSVELPALDLKETLLKSDINTELLVHGSPTVMYLDHDLYENLKVNTSSTAKKNDNYPMDTLLLIDDIGNEHPVFKDNYNRNHILLYKELCLLPILKQLINLNVDTLRLEIQHYSKANFENTLKLYKEALNNPNKCLDLYNNIKSNYDGFTLGSLHYD